MDICGECKEMRFPCDSTTVQIETGLDAGDYQAWIRDIHDNYHLASANVNSNGHASLSLTAFDLAFTPYGGKYYLTFRESTAYDEDLELNIDGNPYNCILLSFYKRD